MQIDYQNLIQNAFFSVVREALKILAQDGIGSHVFYLEFKTSDEGVQIPPHVKAQYPSDMRIVLEHQFKNLEISDEEIKVDLAFGGVYSTVIIPFKSLISFVDPDCQMALHFMPQNEKKAEHIDEKQAEVISLDEMRKKK